MALSVVAWGLVLAGLTGSVARAEPAPAKKAAAPRWTGPRFRQALGRRVSVSWINTSRDQLRQHTLREVTRRAADLWRIAVVLDRRLDPSSELKLVAQNESVQSVLARLSGKANGSISVIGSTVYLGPARPASKLRTLVSLRDAELEALATTPALARRRLRLHRRRTIRYEDLAEPRRVVAEIGRRFGLAIEGLERVPHDLWAAAEFPATTAAEALSLVLIQFDLTFRWSSDAGGVRLVAVPQQVSLTRLLTPPRARTRQSLALLKKELPGLTVESLKGGRLRVRGTWEQLRVAEVLVATGRRPKANGGATRLPPLSRRRFTLKVERAKLIDVIRQLEKTAEVRFVYDPRQLKDAGLSLEKPVAIDVRLVTAEVFFSRLFEPAGLEFSIDGLTITLRPKKQP